MPQDESSKARTYSNKSFIVDMLAGGTASAVSKTVVAPMERVKLLLQVQTRLKEVHSEEHYKGVLDCFAKVWKQQGFLSFWRGNLANIIRVFPLQALNFSLKDRFKGILLKEEYNTIYWKLFLANLASGAAASATSLSIVYPLDFARTRLATDTGRTHAEREFTGMTNCLVKTFKSDGIVGVYRGFWISLPGVIIYRAFSMGCYDSVKAILPPEQKDSLGTSLCIALGMMSLSTVMSHPFDTVRRRMMMQSGRKGDEIMYRSALHCWAKVYKTEGPKAFLRGVLPNVLRSTGGALTLVLYDEFKKFRYGPT